MYILTASVVLIVLIEYLLLRKCCTFPETVRSPAITFFSLHTPHFTFNSSMALLPASLFSSAKHNASKRKFDQI